MMGSQRLIAYQIIIIIMMIIIIIWPIHIFFSFWVKLLLRLGRELCTMLFGCVCVCVCNNADNTS